MGKSICLINPVADMPSYFSAESLAARGLQPAISTADLSIALVAGMVPEGLGVKLCDENITPIDFDIDADYVGITGKVSQWHRMKAVATEFRRRGKTVLIGGPYASLSPGSVRPHCDILVRGEIEEIAPQIFADLISGDWKREYVGTRPDLRTSPMPRWDLYPNDRAIMGSVQTSRGCPFECEFCDVIQYLGRKQRHKQIDQVIAELDQLYDLGYRMVFLADDNFTVYRAHAKTVSRWARRLLGPGGDCEDVVQEVFLVVRRKLPAFDGRAEITTWLYEITVRVVQEWRRRRRWWWWVTGRGPSPSRGRARTPPELPGAEAQDPVSRLEERERVLLLYRVLDGLGEAYRTTFILFELEGLSGERIAEVTGVRLGTVWVRLTRARRIFIERMRRLEKREQEQEE